MDLSLEPTKTIEPSIERAGEDDTAPPVRKDHLTDPVEPEIPYTNLFALPTYRDPSTPITGEDCIAPNPERDQPPTPDVPLTE